MLADQNVSADHRASSKLYLSGERHAASGLGAAAASFSAMNAAVTRGERGKHRNWYRTSRNRSLLGYHANGRLQRSNCGIHQCGIQHVFLHWSRATMQSGKRTLQLQPRPNLHHFGRKATRACHRHVLWPFIIEFEGCHGRRSGCRPSGHHCPQALTLMHTMEFGQSALFCLYPTVHMHNSPPMLNLHQS